MLFSINLLSYSFLIIQWSVGSRNGNFHQMFKMDCFHFFLYFKSFAVFDITKNYYSSYIETQAYYAKTFGFN